MINYKTLHEVATEQDGSRVLVERYWPNGFDQAMDQVMDQASLKIDEWNQNAAPSIALSQWYQQHDFQNSTAEKRQDEFWRRYKQELIAHPEYWMSLLDTARNSNLTLLYSGHQRLSNYQLSNQHFNNQHFNNQHLPHDHLLNHGKMLAEFLEDELDRFNDASSPVCYAHLNKLD